MGKTRTWILTHKMISISAAVLLIGTIGIGTYFFWPHQAAKPVDPEQARVKEMEKKRDTEIAKVEKQIDLPEGEEPILATVSDKNALESQEFFKDAKNGDRVLMYPKTKKAYLYRPSEDRVIAVAPLDFQEDGEVAATSSASAEAMADTSAQASSSATASRSD